MGWRMQQKKKYNFLNCCLPALLGDTLPVIWVGVTGSCLSGTLVILGRAAISSCHSLPCVEDNGKKGLVSGMLVELG